MYKAYKFKLYPNKEQQILINKNMGCSRFVYNYYLNYSKENGYKNKFAYIKDYVTNLKSEYPFLGEVDSMLIRKSIYNLENNYSLFFKKGFGYPKYLSKYDKNAYTTSAVYGKYKDKSYCNIEVDLINKRIKLPKLKWLKIRGYRNIRKIDGRIENATISRDKTGTYYVSVVYEVPNISKVSNVTNIIGIDIGIKNLLTLSSGIKYKKMVNIDAYEKRIRRLERELARKVMKSKNYNKCKLKIARLYKKIANIRKYIIHEITKDITDKNDLIVCETLNTQNMIKTSNNKTLTKNILTSSFGEIQRQLKYKSEEKGKYFYQVDAYYASSQICTVCGNVDKKYKDIRLREYKCKRCKSIIDRDINASMNIEYEGIKKYYKEEFGI